MYFSESFVLKRLTWLSFDNGMYVWWVSEWRNITIICNDGDDDFDDYDNFDIQTNPCTIPSMAASA